MVLTFPSSPHTNQSSHTLFVPVLMCLSDKIKGTPELAWDLGFILFVLSAQWGPVRKSDFLCTLSPEGPTKLQVHSEEG